LSSKKKVKSVKSKKQTLGFRIFRKIIRLFYGNRKFTGLENFPDQASIFIANHAQAHGPITMEYFFPDPKMVWCESKVIDKKEFFDYAMEDFWGHKSKKSLWFYKLFTKIITPIFTWVFKSAFTIPVYRDMRIRNTLKQTIEHLKNGVNVVIFPEKHEPYNNVVNEFQDGFVDVARLYYKSTGKCVQFVPTYNAPKLKTVVVGKPITFNPDNPIEDERKVICNYVKEEITNLAKGLPVHTVIPYENIKKKDYPKSK
jgi:hypothetical protein